MSNHFFSNRPRGFRKFFRSIKSNILQSNSDSNYKPSLQYQPPYDPNRYYSGINSTEDTIDFSTRQDLDESFCEGYPARSELKKQHESQQLPGDTGLRGVNIISPQLLQNNGETSTRESSPRHKDSMDQEDHGITSSSLSLKLQPYSYGFPNIGNTCYMCVVLQCLVNTDKLYYYFIQGGHLAENYEMPLTESFVRVLSSAYTSRLPEEDLVAAVSQIKDALEKMAPIFEGYAQNDAHEFFRLLIEKIHEELNSAPKRSEPYTEFIPSINVRTLYQLAVEWKKYSKERDDSLITSTFGGILLNEIICSNCRHISYSFEDALDLSLTIPNIEEASDIATNLYTCLKGFTTPEPVEGYTCEKCKTKDSSSKRTTIWKQPEILVIQLKRFVCDLYGNMEAVKGKVSFPVTGMTLDPFTHERSNENRGKYRLYGIVNHLGGLDNGHYIAYIYNEELKQWLDYNDNKVSRIDEKEIIGYSQGTSDPYILFYKRV